MRTTPSNFAARSAARRTTNLHAKAWLLERPSGLDTAYIGSSNISHTALFDGLEWNMRLSAQDASHVIDRVRMTFESHWASEHFETYDPAINGEALERALPEHDRRSPTHTRSRCSDAPRGRTPRFAKETVEVSPRLSTRISAEVPVVVVFRQQHPVYSARWTSR